MDYNLYLKYDVDQDLNINDDDSSLLCSHIFAEILHVSDDAVDNAGENYLPERTKIGFINMLEYNHALATVYGLTMAQIPLLRMRINSKPLLELDFCINEGIIDEIGASTNKNIMALHHFGISAEWRNKGIGEQVLKGLIKQMKGKCGYIIISKSEPVQLNTSDCSLYEMQGVELDGLDEDPEKAQFKLNAFWQRCGFRKFKNYDDVFVCNVEQAVPGRLQLKRFAS
jgi:GNAT superfamily N-acetyltransferase